MRRAARGSVAGARRRVAVVLNDLAAGGAQRAAIEQAACLDPTRWDVAVASLELKPDSGWNPRIPRHVTVVRPGIAGLPLWLHRFAPQLVHSHLARATIAAGLAVPLAGGPVHVATCHNLSDWEERRREPLRWLARGALHACDAVVAVSDAVQRAIASADAALGARAEVLRNGTDLTAFEAVRGMRDAAREVLGYRRGTFVVGAVARLEARKGLDLLLEAASAALPRMPGLELLIVGDGPERLRLTQLARERGLYTRARFVGEQSDVRPYLAAFDLFAAPSRSEGLGLALVEALAAGVPVAGSPAGGIPEVLDQGRAGWIVPGGAGAWADAIVRAAREPEACERLRECGLARAEEFGVARMRSALEALYERLLGSAAAPDTEQAA